MERAINGIWSVKRLERSAGSCSFRFIQLQVWPRSNRQRPMRAHPYTKNRLSIVIGVLVLSSFGIYERRVMKQPLNVSSRIYKKIWYVCIRDRQPPFGMQSNVLFSICRRNQRRHRLKARIRNTCQSRRSLRYAGFMRSNCKVFVVTSSSRML